jgi:hypothetical protein
MERRLRLAGWTISVGLFIQLLTLAWVHALAFVIFLMIGTPLVVAGAAYYLYFLILGSPREPTPVELTVEPTKDEVR